MKKTAFLTALFLLVACGPSEDEKQNVAIISCNIISETKNIDPAFKIKEINTAREKIGGEPYLLGAEKIDESVKYGLCTSLILNDPEYQNTLTKLKESEKIAQEKAREELRILRIQQSKKAEEEAKIKKEKQRIAKEQARIAKEKAKEQARIAKEKAEEAARLAEEKAKKEMEIRMEEARKKYAKNIVEKRELENFELIIKKIEFSKTERSYFLNIILDKDQCLKIADLDLKFEFLTKYKDIFKANNPNIYHTLSSFSDSDCKAFRSQPFSISKEEYTKLINFKSEKKIRKNIELFDQISMEVIGGNYYRCADRKNRDKENRLSDLCPQDYPPLRKANYNRQQDILNNHIQKFIWFDE